MDWGFFWLLPGAFSAERVLWCTSLQLAGVFSADDFKRGVFSADRFRKGFFRLKDSAEKTPSPFWKGFFRLIHILLPGFSRKNPFLVERGFFG